MLSIINTTSTLFITIFLGFLCGKVKLFKVGQDQTLINYVFYIALPLNLFLACYHATWHIFNPSYILSYAISMLIALFISYLLSINVFKQSIGGSIVNTLSASQVDGAYFTVPLFLLVFKTDSMAMPLMLIQNTVFFTFGIILLQIHYESKSRKSNYLSFILGRLVHVISHNPVISLSLLGLVAGILKIKIPADILHTAKFLGDSSSAVALFSLGLTCSFYLYSFTKKEQIYPLLSLSFIKLLVLPLISLIIGKLFKLDHQFLEALVLLTASPAATHTYIIAQKYNTDVEIATFNVVLTTLLSFFTINLWLYWLS